MTETKISDLQIGDACHMIGGHYNKNEPVKVAISRVGRSYLYVRAWENRTRPDAREFKFHAESGLEAIDSNYRRKLVIDIDAYQAAVNASTTYAILRKKLPMHLPPDVTAEDIIAAAALLKIDLTTK